MAMPKAPKAPAAAAPKYSAAPEALSSLRVGGAKKKPRVPKATPLHAQVSSSLLKY